MVKYIYVLAVAMAVMCSACSDGDEEMETQPNPLARVEGWTQTATHTNKTSYGCEVERFYMSADSIGYVLSTWHDDAEVELFGRVHTIPRVTSLSCVEDTRDSIQFKANAELLAAVFSEIDVTEWHYMAAMAYMWERDKVAAEKAGLFFGMQPRRFMAAQLTATIYFLNTEYTISPNERKLAARQYFTDDRGEFHNVRYEIRF